MNGDLFDAERMLEHVRPLVLMIDAVGTILEARGGYGGFCGYRPDFFPGRNVLEFVAPAEQHAIASYFVEIAGAEAHSVPMPMPFRTAIVGADDALHDLDVISTGMLDVDGRMTGWLIVLTPLAYGSAATRSLDAELRGESRASVRARLCEELAYDNDWGLLVFFYIDFERGVARVNAPDGLDELRRAIQSAIADGWRPWMHTRWNEGLLADITVGRQDIEAEIPDVVLVAAAPFRTAERELRISCMPVIAAGEMLGAYIDVGFVPPADRLAVNTNVNQRVIRLVNVTRMLEERWRHQDRLVVAATRDSMTGVANRDAFHDALGEASGAVSVLYVDVDRFKEVNDEWGHAIGDRVLTEVARRISSAVRPDDVVARFGGDEFVVLLSDVCHDTGDVIGQRILAAVAQPLGWTSGPESVTVSVGVASDDGTNDVVDAADRAMLNAKRLGRARLSHAHS